MGSCTVKCPATRDSGDSLSISGFSTRLLLACFLTFVPQIRISPPLPRRLTLLSVIFQKIFSKHFLSNYWGQ